MAKDYTPKGYSLDDLPDPTPIANPEMTELTVPISHDARCIVIALLAVTSEIRQLRTMLEAGSEINKLQLEALKAQLNGGISRAVIIPGNPR